jgi:hypothetical protein
LLPWESLCSVAVSKMRRLPGCSVRSSAPQSTNAMNAFITCHGLMRTFPFIANQLSKQQATTLAAALQRRLLGAPKPLKRRYVHGLVSDIIVNREKALITGPRAAIAATVTAGDVDGAVRTSVREWRTGLDSNFSNWKFVVRFRSGAAATDSETAPSFAIGTVGAVYPARSPEEPRDPIVPICGMICGIVESNIAEKSPLAVLTVDEWRTGRDSNPRYSCPYAAFRVRCFQPLSHLSARASGDT